MFSDVVMWYDSYVSKGHAASIFTLIKVAALASYTTTSPHGAIAHKTVTLFPALLFVI
jgi:hypothetical protein